MQLVSASFFLGKASGSTPPIQLLPESESFDVSRRSLCWYVSFRQAPASVNNQQHTNRTTYGLNAPSLYTSLPSRWISRKKN